MTEIKQVTIADGVFIYNGDCREVMTQLEPASVDAIVCDPPYGLEFMGKGWDHGVPGAEFWAEALRVLKPGGHLLAFGGTRTFHRLGVAIEDAGFEIRDTLSWMYGSGFPKSMDVSKAIEKVAAKGGTSDREVPNLGAPIGNTGLCVGDVDPHTGRRIAGVKPGHEEFVDRTDEHSAGGREEGWERPWRSDEGAVLSSHLTFVNESDEAEEWSGWGTALKPSWEPIVMARKPLTKPGARPGATKKATVAETVLEHGTGALNIDATRIGHASPEDLATSLSKNPGRDDKVTSDVYGASRPQQSVNTSGRWPANTLLTHDEGCEQIGTEDGMETVEAWECVEGCPVRLLDEQSGVQKSGVAIQRNGGGQAIFGGIADGENTMGARPDVGYGDTGGASRFFYSSKTSKRERNAGLPEGKKNDHPTVKPIAVMAWLVKLVTPPGGIVLDPFMGSGSTGVAAVQEGFRFIGIDLEPSYCNISWHRLKHAVTSKEGSNE